MNPATRRQAVAISAESLAHQAARQDAAPPGTAVVVDTEISARRRGGSEWRVDDAVAVSVVARPDQLPPEASDVAWAAASLAAAQFLDEVSGPVHRCRWPDAVVPVRESSIDVAVTAATALGPGRLDYAILTARLGPVALLGPREDVVAGLVDQLRRAVRSLDDPTALLSDYRQRCATLGCTVSISLLPSGSTQGIATAVDERFNLIVTSPTGLTDAIAVPSLHRIDELEP